MDEFIRFACYVCTISEEQFMMAYNDLSHCKLSAVLQCMHTQISVHLAIFESEITNRMEHQGWWYESHKTYLDRSSEYISRRTLFNVILSCCGTFVRRIDALNFETCCPCPKKGFVEFLQIETRAQMLRTLAFFISSDEWCFLRAVQKLFLILTVNFSEQLACCSVPKDTVELTATFLDQQRMLLMGKFNSMGENQCMFDNVPDDDHFFILKLPDNHHMAQSSPLCTEYCNAQLRLLDIKISEEHIAHSSLRQDYFLHLTLFGVTFYSNQDEFAVRFSSFPVECVFKQRWSDNACEFQHAWDNVHIIIKNKDDLILLDLNIDKDEFECFAESIIQNLEAQQKRAIMTTRYILKDCVTIVQDYIHVDVIEHAHYICTKMLEWKQSAADWRPAKVNAFISQRVELYAKDYCEHQMSKHKKRKR